MAQPKAARNGGDCPATKRAGDGYFADAASRNEEGTLHSNHSVLLLEDDPHAPEMPWGSGTDSYRKALRSALCVLALGVLGSTVLPVPYAFSKTGIGLGALTMGLVAVANDITCCMMIRAAAHVGCSTYEQLSEWAGGKKARVFTQVSLILLLYGTLCGGLAFLSDVARVMVQHGLGPGRAPALLESDGRPVMVLTVLTVLLPLCLQRHIRQFEKAATAGVVVVVVLCAIIVTRAVQLGFPAVASGELDVLAVKVDEHLPEAFAVLGFAFYMHPMLMPLLKEMPAGPAGMRLTEKAVHITLFGVACGVYGTVGIFGAAIFGASTESNIMVNDLLPGHPTATLALYASLLVYLCCGMVTTHYALRASLDLLVAGPDAPFTWTRRVAETCGILTAATTVALLFPTQAEKIFALTGCTAVCLVCYVIPVGIHLAVQRDIDRIQNQDNQPAASIADGGATDGDLRAPLLAPAAARPHESGGRGSARADVRAAGAGGHVRQDKVVESALGRFTSRVALPAFILMVGVGFSVAGLYVGLVDLLNYLNDRGS